VTTFPVPCPVVRAWEYANQPEHHGAGFWMILRLRDGTVLKGPTSAPDNGVIEVGHHTREGEPGPTVYVRCNDVMTAQIEW